MSNYIFNRIDEGLQHDKPRFLEAPRKHTQEKCLQKPHRAEGSSQVEQTPYFGPQQQKHDHADGHQQNQLHASGK